MTGVVSRCDDVFRSSPRSMAFDAGLVFTSAGDVIDANDAAAPSLVGAFDYEGPIVPDMRSAALFMLCAGTVRPQGWWPIRRRSGSDGAGVSCRGGCRVIHGFGEFHWDEGLFELRYRGAPVAATPRVLELIAYLIRHRDRAVGKDELLTALWKGVNVSETALSQTILLARKALGDDGERQGFIKTVRGRGFRFVADVREAPSATSRRRRDPEWAERTETRHLLPALERVLLGTGSLVLLEGDPGMGKTTTAQQVAELAADRGLLVTWGHCWRDEAPPFWPWIQVLRELSRAAPPDRVQAWTGAHEPVLRRLLDGSAVEPPRDVPHFYGGRPVERFRAIDASASFLRRACEEAAPGRGLLVVLDDLHDADDASLQLLRFLSPVIGRHPLCVLATFTGLAAPPAFSRFRGDLGETAERVTLGPLPAEATARVATRAARSALNARSLQRVHELSGGNPYLAGALARAGAGETDAPLDAPELSFVRVPDRLAAAARRSLQDLPQATRAVLECAAALGGEASMPLLGALTGCATEGELLDRLGPAIDGGIVRVWPGRLRFCHALVRHTAYGDVPAPARAEIHARCATLLEASPDPRGALLGELARHFLLSARSDYREKAARYAVAAARHAESTFGFAAAASLYDRASDVLAEDAHAADAAIEWRIAAGKAWAHAGEPELAVQRFARACEMARARHAAERFAQATLWWMLTRSAFMIYDFALLESIAEGLSLLPEGDHPLRAMLLGHSAVEPGSLGTKARRLATTKAAVEMARRTGDDFALAIALCARVWQLTGVSSPEDVAKDADEIVAMARRSRDEPMLLMGLHLRLSPGLTLGRFESAWSDFDEYTALATKRRDVVHLYWSRLLEASFAIWKGNAAEAERLSLRAVEMGHRIQEPLAPLFHALQRLQLFLDARRGRSHAAPLPRELLAGLPQDPSAATRALWMLLAFAEGDTQRGKALHDELADADFAAVAEDFHRLWVLSALALASSLLPDGPRARRLCELLEPDTVLFVVMPGTRCFFGPVAYFAGVAAGAAGDLPRATRHLQRAVEQCRRANAPIHASAAQAEYERLAPRAS